MRLVKKGSDKLEKENKAMDCCCSIGGISSFFRVRHTRACHNLSPRVYRYALPHLRAHSSGSTHG